VPELEDHREVIVVDHDDTWLLRFEEEKASVAEALAEAGEDR
jgi:hypothetical protein